MHTKDFLAQELRKAGLNEIADRAATGYYHDYLSPLDTPELQLLTDLQDARIAGADEAKTSDIINRHLDGEFDASKEESDEWAASPDGKEAYARLLIELGRRKNK